MALFLAGALVGSGCGGSGPGGGSGELAGTSITFSISVSDAERSAIAELLSRFETRTKASVDLQDLSRFRSQPALNVDLVTSLDAQALVDKLRSDHAAGRPTIQLFAEDNLALRPLVDEGLVQPIDDVGVPSAVIPSLRPPQFGGRRYFLPFRPNVRLAYLDADLARRAGVSAPTTPEDLEEAARRLRDTTGQPKVTFSLAEGDPAAVTVSELVVSFGGDPLVLNDDGSVKAFEFLRRLWDDGVLTRESLFAKFDTEVSYLEEGKSALAENWTFTSAELAKRGVLGRFHVYPGWRGSVRAAHVIGGDVLGIPKRVGGRQRRAAVALARYLMSEEAQELLVDRNAWPSIRTDAYATVPTLERPTFKTIEQALADGWLRPSVPYWPAVTAAMNDAVSKILLRHMPVASVLDDAHRSIQEADGHPSRP